MLEAFKSYLHGTMGLQLELKSWKDAGDLPLFLQDLYLFYTTSLLGKLCILMVARQEDVITPAVIRKHVDFVQEKTGISCIYVSAFASSYNRKRLVAHRVQFVIVGRQIYLPTLGVDWLESCSICRKQNIASKLMSPSTQAIVIYALIHQEMKQFVPLELAKVLNYSPMTMTRAFNELESLGLGKAVRRGKVRLFSFHKDRCLLWTQVEPLMQSPVKKRLWLKLKIKSLGVLAGLSALAEQTMLSQPKHPIYAVSMQELKTLQQLGNIQELPSAEEADIEVEVWGYDPLLFAKNGIVDLFSLYLSLKDNTDERVETVLNKLMKKIK